MQLKLTNIAEIRNNNFIHLLYVIIYSAQNIFLILIITLRDQQKL